MKIRARMLVLRLAFPMPTAIYGLIVAIMVVALWPSAVQAAPNYFFNDPVADRAAFQAAAGAGLLTESFEDPFQRSSSVSFPVGGPEAFVATARNTQFRRDSFARGVSDGQYCLAFDEEGVPSATFTFTVPTTAFGIDMNDLNFVSMSFADDLGNSYPNVLLGDDGGPGGGPGYENRQFFGVTNDVPLTWVRLDFSHAQGLTGTLFIDRLQYNIPEPAALSLLALGGLALIRRRR